MSSVHAFFDFDDTLLDGDSILYWMRFYYRRRPRRRFFLLANWAGLLLFLVKLIDGHALKRIFLWPMAYENPAVLDRMAEEFVRQELAHRFNLPVLRRFWTHRLLGHKLMIISASATFYLKHLRALFPGTEIEGTEVVWAEKGLWRFPRYRYGNLRGAKKIARLNALGFGAEAPFSFAYSDHHHDESLLRFAEFPFCVRPTSKLRRLARREGWPVMDWKRARPAWKVKLAKLRLLILASGKDEGIPGAVALNPEREDAAAREYGTSEIRVLRECVAGKYPEARNPDVYKRIFGRGLAMAAKEENVQGI